MNAPPDRTPQVLHSFEQLYKLVYETGRARQMEKYDRYGLWQTVEREALSCYALLIEAAFAVSIVKTACLTQARTKIEIIKRLIRTAHELKIIESKRYLDLEIQLISISKQVGGWIKYVSS